MASKTSDEMLQIAEETLVMFCGISHDVFSTGVRQIGEMPDSDEKNDALRKLLQSMSDALETIEAD